MDRCPGCYSKLADVVGVSRRRYPQTSGCRLTMECVHCGRQYRAASELSFEEAAIKFARVRAGNGAVARIGGEQPAERGAWGVTAEPSWPHKIARAIKRVFK